MPSNHTETSSERSEKAKTCDSLACRRFWQSSRYQKFTGLWEKPQTVVFGTPKDIDLAFLDIVFSFYGQRQGYYQA